jgi:hypothetical protein
MIALFAGPDESPGNLVDPITSPFWQRNGIGMVNASGHEHRLRKDDSSRSSKVLADPTRELSGDLVD